MIAESIIEEVSGKYAAVFVVGGAAGNIGRALFEMGCDADIIAVNTDREALDNLAGSIDYAIPLAEGSTSGNLALAEEYARSKEMELRAHISKYSHICIVAALGGAAGSAVSPVIAEYCRAEGKDFSVFAVMPFSFEGRDLVVAEGFRALSAQCADKGNMNRISNDDAIESFGAHSFPEALDGINRMIATEICEILKDVPHDPRRRIPPQDSDDPFTIAGVRVAAI